MLTTSGRNQLLDATDAAYAAAHSGYPGSTGASNELTGGSPAYARKAITYASAASGAKASNADITIDVPALTTVNWISAWTASTAGTCRLVSPNGADPKEFAADASSDLIWTPGNSYTNGDQVTVYGVGNAPAGLTKGTTYFVVNASGEKCKLSATNGGSAIDLTDEGDGDVMISKIVAEIYGGQGTFKIASGNISIALNF